MKQYIILLLVIFSIFFHLFPPAMGESIDSGPDYGTQSTTTETPKTTIPAGTSTTDYNGGKSSSRTTITYSSMPEDLVTVKKTVMPPSKEAYMLGNPLCVVVEIKNNYICGSSWTTIDNLTVYETVDDELSLSNDSIGYFLSEEPCEVASFYSKIYITSNKDQFNCLNTQIDSCTCNATISSISPLFNWNISETDGYFNKYNFNHIHILGILNKIYGIEWADTSRPIKYHYNKTNCCIKFVNDEHKWVEISYTTNTSCSILNIANERSYPMMFVLGNTTLEFSDITKIIKIPNNTHKIHLGPRDRLIYWYYINPKNAGLYYTNTIIKSSVYRPNIDYPLNIEIIPPIPEFDVSLKLATDRIFLNKPLSLIYDITYLGGGSDPCNDISTKSDNIYKNPSYYIYLDDCGRSTSDIITRNLPAISKRHTEQVAYFIKYPLTGVFSVPGIWINGKHYGFESTHITVDSPYSRYDVMLFLGLVISGLGLIGKKSTGSKRSTVSWPVHYTLFEPDFSLNHKVSEWFNNKLEWIKMLWRQGRSITIYNSFHWIKKRFLMDELPNTLVYIGLIAVIVILICELASWNDGIFNWGPFNWWL